MCVYIYIYIYICIHICIHTYTSCIHICTCMYAIAALSTIELLESDYFLHE